MNKSWAIIAGLLSIMLSSSSYSSQSEYSLYTISPNTGGVLWSVGVLDTEKLVALSLKHSAATGVDLDSGVIRGYHNTCPDQLLFSQQKPTIVASSESASSIDICPSYDDGYVITKKANGLTTACHYFNRNQYRLVTDLLHALVQPPSVDQLSLDAKSFDLTFKNKTVLDDSDLSGLKVSVSFSNGRLFITSGDTHGWGEYDVVRGEESVTFTGLVERRRRQSSIELKGSYDGSKLFNVTMTWQGYKGLEEYVYGWKD